MACAQLQMKRNRARQVRIFDYFGAAQFLRSGPTVRGPRGVKISPYLPYCTQPTLCSLVVVAAAVCLDRLGFHDVRRRADGVPRSREVLRLRCYHWDYLSTIASCRVNFLQRSVRGSWLMDRWPFGRPHKKIDDNLKLFLSARHASMACSAPKMPWVAYTRANDRS